MTALYTNHRIPGKLGTILIALAQDTAVPDRGVAGDAPAEVHTVAVVHTGLRTVPKVAQAGLTLRSLLALLEHHQRAGLDRPLADPRPHVSATVVTRASESGNQARKDERKPSCIHRRDFTRRAAPCQLSTRPRTYLVGNAG